MRARQERGVPQPVTIERIQEEFPEAEIFLEAARRFEGEIKASYHGKGPGVHLDTVNVILLQMANDTHPGIDFNLTCDAYSSRPSFSPTQRRQLAYVISIGYQPIPEYLKRCRILAKEVQEEKDKEKEAQLAKEHSNVMKLIRERLSKKRPITQDRLSTLAHVHILLHRGLANSEIANRLGLDADTIRRHFTYPLVKAGLAPHIDPLPRQKARKLRELIHKIRTENPKISTDNLIAEIGKRTGKTPTLTQVKKAVHYLIQKDLLSSKKDTQNVDAKVAEIRTAQSNISFNELLHRIREEIGEFPEGTLRQSIRRGIKKGIITPNRKY